jgi:transposase
MKPCNWPWTSASFQWFHPARSVSSLGSMTQYDKAMYRRRNEIERLFRRLKGFRRIFSRFDKLDLVFLAFLHFALIVEALRYLISINIP